MKCKFCGNLDAYIVLEDFRYMVRCPNCGYSGYLKTYNSKQNANTKQVFKSPSKET